MKDPSSINDSKLTVDEEQGMGLVDFPSPAAFDGLRNQFCRWSCLDFHVHKGGCGSNVAPLYHPGKVARGKRRLLSSHNNAARACFP